MTRRYPNPSNTDIYISRALGYWPPIFVKRQKSDATHNEKGSKHVMILRVHVHGLFGFLALVSGGATGNAVTPTIRFNHELPPFEQSLHHLHRTNFMTIKIIDQLKYIQTFQDEFQNSNFTSSSSDTPGQFLLRAPFIKDGIAQGKGSRSSIEEVSGHSHEPRPDAISGLIQSEDHNHEGIKKVGQADQHGSIDLSLSRLENQHINSAIKERITGKSEDALSLHHDQEKLAAKQAEFHSMLQSFADTEEEIEQTFFVAAHLSNHPAVQITDPDTKILASVVDRLRVVHNVLLSIHGTPDTLPDKSLIAKTQSSVRLKAFTDNAVKIYDEGVHDLFQLVQTPTYLPPAFYHLRLASNSCILQTLAYLRKYKLIPTDLEESIDSTLKSPAGLEWIARQTQEAFLPDSRYSNRFHHPLNEVEFLENHPQLVQYSHLFKGLEKKEQDLVLFNGLKISMTSVYRHTYQTTGYDPVTICTAAKGHTDFMEKMEKILLKELQPGHHQQITVEDLSEVRQDILNIKNFLMEPVVGPETDAVLEHHLMRYSFLILDFLQRKFGPDYMEKVGLSNKEHNTDEFQTIFAFMKSTGRMELWRLMEELPNYMRISHRMDQDPKWEAILGKNLYVHGFKWHWDYEIQTLGGYLDDFLALARVKRGHSIDLPPSYYLYDPPRTS
ncbi:hypothetical protein PSTT_07653 [Puccinia striiformis]|uniref:Uncharacterized protein n=1 Tax=Puccinia striiformis TaxID=27350 RepID=A0A2S4VFC0_9BASI|nr:hypothetical protein PSTT_07653 [Puccinia striiformis]